LELGATQNQGIIWEVWVEYRPLRMAVT
jgi:hypothetical protein